MSHADWNQIPESPVRAAVFAACLGSLVRTLSIQGLYRLRRTNCSPLTDLSQVEDLFVGEVDPADADRVLAIIGRMPNPQSLARVLGRGTTEAA